jgi:hypothetical protein
MSMQAPHSGEGTGRQRTAELDKEAAMGRPARGRTIQRIGRYVASGSDICGLMLITTALGFNYWRG